MATVYAEIGKTEYSGQEKRKNSDTVRPQSCDPVEILDLHEGRDCEHWVVMFSVLHQETSQAASVVLAFSGGGAEQGQRHKGQIKRQKFVGVTIEECEVVAV